MNTVIPKALAFAVCLVPLLPYPASAVWDAVISEQFAHPSYFVAVDKTRQKLAFFEKQSPLRIARVFICTTGQKEGDKAVEGDLKTPEGVYFVVRRIDSGLDFIKYGPRAYTLNYPNPVDRMRGKTGFGIWIHGRGEPLVPLQTEGCVAMNNDDLSILGKALLPGAPVALTRSFAFGASGAGSDDDLRRLEQKVRDWAEAWSGRSRRFFDFYDREAYSAAQGENFSAFRAQKERLFTLLPWIRTTVRDVRILAGPDYWVTWFHQDYQAPNLSTRGTRRLYWEKTGTDFKIVGMEWEPGLVDAPLTASAASLMPPSEQDDPLALLDAVWRAPDDASYVASAAGASGYSAHDAGASASVSAAGEVAGGARPPAGTQTEAAAAETAPDAGSAFSPTAGAITPAGANRRAFPNAAPPASSAAGRVSYASDASDPIDTAGQSVLSTPDHIEDPAFGPMPRPSEAAFRLAARRVAERERAVKERNEPPAQQLSRSGDASGATAASAGAGGQAARPDPARAVSSGNAADEGSPTDAQRPARGRQAAREVELNGVDTATVSDTLTVPAAESGKAEDARRSARTDPLRDAAGAVTERIEAWRAAWERGDLKDYASFYAPRAIQGERRGAAEISRHKAALWRRNPPVSVRLTDVRVQLHRSRPVADMHQEYADRAGGGDTGIKTLTFEKINGVWLITREEWRGIEAGH
ncbi:MAG: L,D-transpeptidase family protein [Desulfovibrio sp.]|nr:L,D-transpeptidase family protein [Desulfovibrio sp.]